MAQSQNSITVIEGMRVSGGDLTVGSHTQTDITCVLPCLSALGASLLGAGIARWGFGASALTQSGSAAASALISICLLPCKIVQTDSTDGIRVGSGNNTKGLVARVYTEQGRKMAYLKLPEGGYINDMTIGGRKLQNIHGPYEQTWQVS